MVRRPRLRPVLMAMLMAVGGLYAVASYDWCGKWPPVSPRLVSSHRAEGGLGVGAWRAPLQPPYPVVVAGYGPPRPEVSQAASALHARALVLETSSLRLGLVAIDLLTAPSELVEQVRAEVASLGFSAVWVVATHSHSSLGGYDRGLMAQVAGTGRFRAQAERAVVDAAATALREAAAAVEPAQLWLGQGTVEQVVARSGQGCDQRLSRLAFRRTDGTFAAQLLLVSAHPTLVPRPPTAVSPDYPGALAQLEEAAGHGTTLVVQGAGGNAAAFGQSVDTLGQALHQALASGELSAPEGSDTVLAHSRVEVPLPHPDAQRLVPRWARRVGDNFVCLQAPRVAEVNAMAIGPITLLSVPGEPTFSAGTLLEQASGAQRVMGLANGYLGYVEPAEVVEARAGESRRQYYARELLERLAEGARLAAQALPAPGP